ncbi:hypothetical protein Dip510_000907 [Elusimicrobium posterum]|uniref:DUF2924 domain-containing protein n=1 Tax=Elusimicrobium posterum TaxID=3116653 RepID=UPI003C70B0E3
MAENIEKRWKSLSAIPMPKLRRQLLLKYIRLFENLQKENISVKKYFSIRDKYEVSYLKGTALSKTFESGSKFIRSYKGEQHEVEVLSVGFLYRDNKYRSLSAIAKEITGTQWNGKLFFGVKNDRK